MASSLRQSLRAPAPEVPFPAKAPRRPVPRAARLAAAVALAALFAPGIAPAAPPKPPPAAPAEAPAATPRFFETVEQSLMDAVGKGDRGVWQAVMDPSCVVTTEEGEWLDRARFLDELRPLPAGLSGAIAVRDLTVQQLEDVAIVRYLADETEQVFGQSLATKYRTTDVFRHEGAAGWKLVASHTSVVTEDPPAQTVATSAWPDFAGAYRLLPDGWTMTVALRDGRLFAGRDPAKLRPLVPLAPDAFVLSGSLGDLVFARDARGRVDRIVEVRKFEVLVWTRVGGR